MKRCSAPQYFLDRNRSAGMPTAGRKSGRERSSYKSLPREGDLQHCFQADFDKDLQMMQQFYLSHLQHNI